MRMHIQPNRSRRRTVRRALAGAVALVLGSAGLAAAGPDFSVWGTAEKIDDIAGNDENLNTTSLDGCPAQSPDGLSLYMASDRDHGHGGLDIWVASRRHRGDPWGEPVNLPAPVNSTANDFCPTPFEGDGLLFVSNRSLGGAQCGMGDIFVTRRNPSHGWSDPQHLACAPLGPNSTSNEQGPSYAQGQLYFSRNVTALDGELFVSGKQGVGFGPATPISMLNDSTAHDIQPNVRKDGRELVFSSNRAGSANQDIWMATRPSVHHAWSTPVNLGAGVNTGVNETRPFLSSDGEQLLFGRAPGGEGSSDIFVSTRVKNP